jgi:hypothetical protein
MSLDKSTILKIFNEHFVEFIEDIASIFPEEDDLILAKNYLLIMKKTNPKLLIHIFYNNIYLKYNDKFEQNDMDYFIEKDYQEDFTENKNSAKIIQSIDHLRSSIKNMNEQNKSKTIKYLQNLCKLANSYVHI